MHAECWQLRVIYTVSQKTTLMQRLNADQPIFVIFGRDVAALPGET